jgi:hypothetical protein
MGRYARGTFLGGRSASDVDAVRRALADVDMTEHAMRTVHELSGGEFRRVLVAQALAQEAPALLLDEPVQQLDLLHQIEVMELVRRIAPASAIVCCPWAPRHATRRLLAHGTRRRGRRAWDNDHGENHGRSTAWRRRWPAIETGAVRVVPLRPAAWSAGVVEGEDAMKWAMGRESGRRRCGCCEDRPVAGFFLFGGDDALVAEARGRRESIHVRGGGFVTVVAPEGRTRIDSVNCFVTSSCRHRARRSTCGARSSATPRAP